MKRLALALAVLLWASAGYPQGFPTKYLATANPSCTSSSSQAVAARYRNGVTISVPSGGVAVAIGNTAGVTFATGFQIASGAALTLEPYAGAVYCITSSSSQSVSVIESF